MNDLIKRLREADTYNKKYYAVDPLHQEAAHRIEQLVKEKREAALSELAALGQAAEAYDAQRAAEAKLVKAMEALRWIKDHRGECFIPEPWDDMVNDALAELEGGKND